MQSIQNDTIEFKEKISALICPECRSSNIIRNREGFNVCNKCGTVLNTPNFEKPLRKKYYWASKNSYWQLPNRTTIGTKQERKFKYKKASQHMLSDPEKFQMKKTVQAHQEVSRLCSCLDVSDDIREQVVYIYQKIRNKIQKYSLGQQIQVIIPVITFRLLKNRGYRIKIKEIHLHMKCNSEQFRRILIDTYHDSLFICAVNLH